jgi:CheY-like chemotaxis protein
MEAIGQLAGGVAHDFNNILSAILMHLGLLQQSPQLTIGVKEALKEVESETMRAANLTRQLLLFSRRQVARFEPLDMNALINDLLKLLRRLLGERIEIDFQGSRDAAWVEADAGMLEQLIMNLCLNARDAMPAGGRLSLGTTLVERNSGSEKTLPDARPGWFVCLVVSDAGCGMDEAVRKRLFEPFFTTKGLGKGTGLGLATVYGIVQQHEGWIEVESAVGKGSSFRVYFPALETPTEKAPITSRPEEPRGGSETILLVEDDASVRRMTALCLRKFGYAVLEATNGAEALKQWEQHRQKIALLLTDMVMPEAMTGLELAQRLRKDKPGLRVIVASGYSANLVNPDPLEPEVIFLAKPFRPAALAKLVRQCLDKT